MGTTSRGYPTPEGSDNVDIPGDLSALASAINTDVGSVDTAKAAKATTITAGTGLTGGGDLSANRTLSVATGGVTDAMLAGSIAPAKVTGTAVVQARQVATGTGLTGGGDLSANRTLAVSYGTTAGTAAQGNDARITGAVQSSLVDAKGDLYVGTADNTVARLAAPADGRVLVADSTQTTGWTSAAMGNLLTPNEANGVAANWQGGFIDCTVTDAGGTPSPAAGSSVFKLTRVGSPSFTFMYTQQGTSSGTTYGAPVVPGQWYTFSVYVRGDAANATQGNAAIQVVFRTAAGAAVSTPTSATTAVSAAEWQRIVYVSQAPATAAIAQIRPYFTNVVSNHIAYVSGITVHQGAGGLWVPPGIPVPNLGTRANPADATQVQVWNPGNNTWITV